MKPSNSYHRILKFRSPSTSLFKKNIPKHEFCKKNCLISGQKCIFLKNSNSALSKSRPYSQFPENCSMLSVNQKFAFITLIFFMSNPKFTKNLQLACWLLWGTRWDEKTVLFKGKWELWMANKLRWLLYTILWASIIGLRRIERLHCCHHPISLCTIVRSNTYSEFGRVNFSIVS